MAAEDVKLLDVDRAIDTIAEWAKFDFESMPFPTLDKDEKMLRERYPTHACCAPTNNVNTPCGGLLLRTDAVVVCEEHKRWRNQLRVKKSNDWHALRQKEAELRHEEFLRRKLPLATAFRKAVEDVHAAISHMTDEQLLDSLYRKA